MNSAGHITIFPDRIVGGYAPWPLLPSNRQSATAQQFQSVASVEGVNIVGRISLLDLRSAGCSVEAMNRLFHPENVKASALVAAESEPAVELSTMSTIALLRMNHISTLCRGIATHLQNEIQDTPSRFDYVPLVAQGLARRPAEGERWHTITPKGSCFATNLARAKAKELGIHIMIEGGKVGAQAEYSCTCGKWNVAYRRGQFTSSNALRGWARHVADASPTKEAESA